MRRGLFLLWSAMVLTALRAPADIRLPALLSDHMVLQRDVPVRIWGWSDPGERVSVAIRDRSAETVADGQGFWEVHLAPLPAGEAVTMTVAGKNRVTVRDILVGEVWVAAGQSNMWWPVSRTDNAAGEIARAGYPGIRLFTMPVRVAPEPTAGLRDPTPTPLPEPPVSAFAGRWAVCSANTVPDFSGVAYYFGRRIHEDQDVPVGLVSLAMGGSVIAAWTSREALGQCDEGRSLVAYWDRYEAGDGPIDASRYVNRASALFNGMVSPVTRFSVRGALWYQGESDSSQAAAYHALLPVMIRDWRRAWGLDPFFFLIVQLPNLDTSLFPSIGNDWPTVREAQARALALPHTGLAVTIDIGEDDNAHPSNKQQVGRRLALTAEALVYGKDVVCSGPRYESFAVEGDRIRVRFDPVEGGLTAGGGEPAGFAVAGRDRRFIDARAEIDGSSVLVWSEEVPEPVAVRYAWSSNPRCNLRNQAGLPAAPFRTDAWSIEETATPDARAGGGAPESAPERTAAAADGGSPGNEVESGVHGSFDGAVVGFWQTVGNPAGWISSDPARTYTAGAGFIQVPFGVTVARNTGLKVEPHGRYQFQADLGGDQGSLAVASLIATEHADGTGRAVELAHLSREGTEGYYERTPTSAAGEPVPGDAAGFFLRVELSVRRPGSGYFDNLVVTRKPGRPSAAPE